MTRSMRTSEWFTDPNVAAFYIHHAGWRVVVYRPNPLKRSRWGDLFCWWSTAKPPVGPNQCRRIGDRTLHMGVIFARRVDLYVNSYRLEGRERLEERTEAA